MQSKIYALYDINGDIRYVGKTSRSLDERGKEHIEDAKRGQKNHRCNWLRQCLDQGHTPMPILIEEVDGNGNDREVFWINYYTQQGIKLVNGTLGGDGVVPTEETRKIMSDACKGRCLSDSAKHKLSLANKGKTISNETRMKISIAKKGWKPTPEMCLKNSQAHIGKEHWSGRKHNEDSKHKMSLAKKGKPSPAKCLVWSDDSRMKQSLAQKGRIHSPLTKLRMWISRRKFLSAQQNKISILNIEEAQNVYVRLCCANEGC